MEKSATLNSISTPFLLLIFNQIEFFYLFDFQSNIACILFLSLSMKDVEDRIQGMKTARVSRHLQILIH